jgi:hypothetical protein
MLKKSVLALTFIFLSLNPTIAFAGGKKKISTNKCKEIYKTIEIREHNRNLLDTWNEISRLEQETKELLAPNFISPDNTYARQFQGSVSTYVPSVDVEYKQYQRKLEDEQTAIELSRNGCK